MVCVGIDVAKDKHDCCILDSEGTTLVDCFTIPNNMDGFKSLLQTIQDCSQKSDKIKVGLEATGHYTPRQNSRGSVTNHISIGLFPTSSRYAFKNSAARLLGRMFSLASCGVNHLQRSTSWLICSAFAVLTKAVKLHISVLDGSKNLVRLNRRCSTSNPVSSRTSRTTACSSASPRFTYPATRI